MTPKTKYVSCKVYDSTKDDFSFPELEYDEIKNKKNIGICFSGGGTRSASLTMGQLRALNTLGVLPEIRYLSAVSGGSWGSFPFMFLDEKISDEHFLGEYVQPADLKIEQLKEDKKESLTYAISNSKIFDDFIKQLGAGDERYAHIISDIFLSPFNLGNRKKFFTYNKKSRDEILRQNPNLDEDFFYMVNKRNNRPFPIAGGTILRPKLTRYPFEMTPLYVGVNQLFENAGSFKKYHIGGGYIEPHGFDSDSPHSYDPDTNEAYVRLGRTRHMFTLGDVIGTSGAAPAEYAERFKLEFLGFPEFKYWSPAEADGNPKSKEYDFGDGGILENSGIMPLLKRGVKKIIVFSNGSTPLSIQTSGEIELSSSIPALFHKLPNQYGEKDFTDNIVFAKQEKKYKALVKKLYQLKADGKPAIVKDTYAVTEQPCHGIKGGYDVEIIWVYNDIVRNWINALPVDIQIRLGKNEFGKTFPMLATFMENFPHIIDLRSEQANLAAHLSSWNLFENADLIKEFVATAEQ
ncbi:hypothetical protein [uncultured Draconibacterium sp.]|uniref:hypothetical protein n=1 Tax=uncultured Draconibacterium sp. TaxID=1573823 RepID=UPI003217B0FF